MTTELQMLTYAAVLMIVQSLSVLIAHISVAGLRYGFGNRDEDVALPGWGERVVRAHRNMLENLIPFTALVLAAHLAGVSNDETARGATFFFWGRVAHALIYVAGVPYLRTVAFIVAIGGMFEIAGALIRAAAA
ncbi:MAG: MAPEG family protein [Myxococcota bacterium]